MLYYILQFTLGGMSVVAITLIAKYIDPKYTGVVYAFPVILIVSSIFIYLDQGMADVSKSVKSTFVYKFSLIYFILAFYLLLGRTGFWWAMVISLVTWIGLASVIQFVVKL